MSNKINKKGQEAIFLKKRLDKKGQEEMVGFVLIIVLVAVIAVIFLGITLRNPTSSTLESQQIASFLSSLSQVTTDCEIPLASKKNVGELIIKCAENKVCANNDVNQVSACEILENTLKEAMEAGYLVNEDSFTRSYNLTIYDSFDNSPIVRPIIVGNRGMCPGRVLNNNKPFTISGLNNQEIVMNLEVCFNPEN